MNHGRSVHLEQSTAGYSPVDNTDNFKNNYRRSFPVTYYVSSGTLNPTHSLTHYSAYRT